MQLVMRMRDCVEEKRLDQVEEKRRLQSGTHLPCSRCPPLSTGSARFLFGAYDRHSAQRKERKDGVFAKILPDGRKDGIVQTSC